jgi:hypothetical protein
MRRIHAPIGLASASVSNLFVIHIHGPGFRYRGRAGS